MKVLLDQDDFKIFEPFGRNRGKNFVAIVHSNRKDFAQDEALFMESADYVTS